MSYTATVHRVLIASPSDVERERNMIRDLVYQWNDVHSPSTGVVLLPVLWETHAVPQMGTRPQGIINRQLVENTDLLIGVFWTKLGTHTGHAESGTAEEIEEFRRRGKPVLLYFSSAPAVPDSIDLQQYQRLKEYKQSVQNNGLFWEYSTVDELRFHIDRHLVETVNQMAEITTAPTTVDDDAGELHSALGAIVRETTLRWETERDSQPVSIDEGQLIMGYLAEGLIQYLVAAQVSLDPQTIERIRSAVTEARELQRHRVYIDGGTSYREFWSKGDTLLADLTTLAKS